MFFTMINACAVLFYSERWLVLDVGIILSTMTNLQFAVTVSWPILLDAI